MQYRMVANNQIQKYDIFSERLMHSSPDYRKPFYTVTTTFEVYNCKIRITEDKHCE